MRVLMVHNYYQQLGGEDRSFAAEVSMLRERGVEVVTWTVHNDDIVGRPSTRLAFETIWNRRAAKEIRRRLAADGPFDVVHFQNTFPLISPAAIWASGRSESAVVQSLRNYRLMCVNGLFYRAGNVCELCIDKWLPLPGVVHACYRSSVAASATVALMNFHQRTKSVLAGSVDAFIALSEFARSKYMHAGLDQEHIHVKPNFVTPDPGIGKGSGSFAIFVGRLEAQKGIATLLQAWQHVGSRLPLLVVGDGPLAEQVEAACARSRGAIRWLGQKSASDVNDLIGESRLLVFPSESYETFGRVAVEAFAKGTPVVASDIGAIAELVEDGKTGRRFEPGNASDLADKVLSLINSPDPGGWRQRARAAYEERYTADRNFDVLLHIYRSAIARKASSLR